MPSYQIPQFLDSGEKIFLNLNIRQFAYALAGGALGVALFYGIGQSFLPQLGWFNLVFCVPSLPFVYLAIGKYNGRDSEVYVFKSIIYFLKPRLMKFSKQPDNSDLDQKMSDWTYEKVLNRWRGLESDQKALETNAYKAFEDSSASERIKTIQSLARTVNDPTVNIATTISYKEGLASEKKKLAETIEKVNRDKRKQEKTSKK
ncbi:MAG: PrgI family protein [Candidatus Parcubacteria bacterium]|nr:PrgI family protein [Candidatus Paceibacterota bacterium]